MDNLSVHNFAVRWLEKFYNENSSPYEIVESNFAEECFSLKFEMDCGHSFGEKYPKAFNDVDELEKVIGSITDIHFLGTAIFSQWRYFNHWAYSASEIFEPHNRKWFIVALERLKELSGCVSL